MRGALREAAARGEAEALLRALSPGELTRLERDWALWARGAQLPPPGDWRVWLILGGRGAGKTRAGAEWVRSLALSDKAARIALVAETFKDAREVMVEGVSGLLSVHGAEERPRFLSSRHRLEWPGGAVAELFSAEDPEALRGPQFSAAWCDEVAKWAKGRDTWDMLQFGLRLGARPRALATTTPRPVPLLKELLARPDVAVTRMATAENEGNLATGFVQAMRARYGGTRLGRQELDGELIEDREDGLFPRAVIEAARVERAPELARVVVAVDPPAGAGATSDACGIVAAGEAEGAVYVLADASARGLRPDAWARRAVELYERMKADRLVAEANQGGEMVAAVLRQVDPGLPLTLVHATRGKWLRAEPVAALYEQGRVRHVGAFPELEDEMCDFGPGGLSGGGSPDRLDALVWAVTALALGRPEPRVRRL
ncbi:terminase large subunit domain-containing protein [Lutibaculum baratangense]|uniref:DNA-packaging protein n=1 Tax=Lutibaculum baratangense TaxID=1358440 RepID=UPI000590CA0F